MDDKYIEVPDGPTKFVQERGFTGAMEDLYKIASGIARSTRLGPNESWDDPEEWELPAVKLAHGLVALGDELRRKGILS